MMPHQHKSNRRTKSKTEKHKRTSITSKVHIITAMRIMSDHHPSRIRLRPGKDRKGYARKMLMWLSLSLVLAMMESQRLGVTITVIDVVNAEKAYPLGCSHRDPAYYDYENSVFPPVPITVGDGDTITHVPIKTDQDYLLTRRLGAGKFSDVFEAVDAEQERRQKILSSTLSSTGQPTRNNSNDKNENSIDPETLVVLKCLKPVAERKIKRELLVLRHASKLPNLARIKAIVLPKEADTKGKPSNNSNKKYRIKSMPTLVLEHAHGDWFCHPIKQQKQRQLQQQKTKTSSTLSAANSYLESASYLTEYEIRYYLLHLLVALDHLHSCGIMHRDVKPRNVLIDRRATAASHGRSFSGGVGSMYSGAYSASSSFITSPLMLIDLGLADFYHPGTRYNVRVASRHYKSPELLLGPSFGYYDYAIDLWGVGCILAGLLFRKEPFFRGKNNVDQLGVIIQVLGTTDLLKVVTSKSHEESGGYELLPEEVKELIEEYITQGEYFQRRPWTEFLPSKSDGQSQIPQQQSASPNASPQTSTLETQRPLTLFESQGMDLLDKLLVYDGDQRWTARQAMYHPFFDEVRRDVLGQVQLAA